VLEAQILGMATDNWEGKIVKNYVENLVTNVPLVSFSFKKIGWVDQ
jgi:uncharacterized membrane-anchored protein YitT (DUF2179 family)